MDRKNIMNELDRLIEESELDSLRQHREKTENDRKFYERAIKADAKAIKNFDALPRPLKPPGRS